MSNRSNSFETVEETTLPTMIRHALHAVRQQLGTMRSRRRLRDELLQCSDRELADMGLSRRDIGAIVAGVRMQ